jgi:hypothetical protein
MMIDIPAEVQIQNYIVTARTASLRYCTSIRGKGLRKRGKCVNVACISVGYEVQALHNERQFCMQRDRCALMVIIHTEC